MDARELYLSICPKWEKTEGKSSRLVLDCIVAMSYVSTNARVGTSQKEALPERPKKQVVQFLGISGNSRQCSHCAARTECSKGYIYICLLTEPPWVLLPKAVCPRQPDSHGVAISHGVAMFGPRKQMRYKQTREPEIMTSQARPIKPKGRLCIHALIPSCLFSHRIGNRSLI